MKFFLITLVNGEHRGTYRFMATIKEIAISRAQVSFRREFGKGGMLERVEQQVTYLDGDEEEGKNV